MATESSADRDRKLIRKLRKKFERTHEALCDSLEKADKYEARYRRGLTEQRLQIERLEFLCNRKDGDPKDVLTVVGAIVAEARVRYDQAARLAAETAVVDDMYEDEERAAEEWGDDNDETFVETPGHTYEDHLDEVLGEMRENIKLHQSGVQDEA